MNDEVDLVRAYHQVTKHSTQAYAPSPGFLDWDAQPDPFRRFLGAPTISLPFVKEGHGRIGYDDLYAVGERTPEDLTTQSLGLFFELALGLSAWKVAGPDRWSMRNNPSSGNLHPTEGYLLLWRKASEDLVPGLYHYAPHDHVLECRAVLLPQMAAEVAEMHPNTFGAVAFSTITWREEWKYGARAYRYCQLDIGHALASARYSAAVLGWGLALDSTIGDETLSTVLGLDRILDFAPDTAEAEPELPDAIAVLGTPVSGMAVPWDRLAMSLSDWRGTATQASAERVSWPQIAAVLAAVHKPDNASEPRFVPPSTNAPSVTRPLAAEACALIRSRRSAQRMDKSVSLDRAAFERALYRTLPSSSAPFDMVPFWPALNLIVYVHGVEDLAPGLYALIRSAPLFDDFRQACRAQNLAWESVDDTTLPLYRLDAPADYRRLASQFSCYQGIAGHGAFSVSMIAATGQVLAAEGGWAYRRLHWEAGLIGQVLYLEAEASGLQGTGIGCFFDDEVHKLLGLETTSTAPWQNLYHFTVGAGLDDPRLATEPPYIHLTESSLP